MRGRTLGICFMGLLAAAGGVVLWDVLLGDGAARSAFRHRVVAIFVGGLLLLPVVLAVVFRGRSSFLRRVVFALIPLFVLLLVVEVVLRVIGVRGYSLPVLVPDEALGYVHSSSEPGIDGWGFRNEKVPERADVVCIGDSQTYGFFLLDHETWPSYLAEGSGPSTYNMSAGGYGPLQYLALTKRALTLEPRAIVVCFYLGNDIADAWRWASLDHWKRLRSSSVSYPGAQAVPGREPAPNLGMAIIDKVSACSRLVGWAQHVVSSYLKNRNLLQEAREQEGGDPGSDEAGIATRFTPRYRTQTLDRSRENIGDGLRITGQCMGEMAELCRARDVQLFALVLSTKEFYYHELDRERGRPTPPALQKLARVEAQVRSALADQAASAKVALLDPRDVFVACLEQGRALWPATSDGHINADGCRVLAEFVADALRRLKPR